MATPRRRARTGWDVPTLNNARCLVRRHARTQRRSLGDMQRDEGAARGWAMGHGPPAREEDCASTQRGPLPLCRLVDVAVVVVLHMLGGAPADQEAHALPRTRTVQGRGKWHRENPPAVT